MAGGRAGSGEVAGDCLDCRRARLADRDSGGICPLRARETSLGETTGGWLPSVAIAASSAASLANTAACIARATAVISREVATGPGAASNEMRLPSERGLLGSRAPLVRRILLALLPAGVGCLGVRGLCVRGPAASVLSPRLDCRIRLPNSEAVLRSWSDIRWTAPGARSCCGALFVFDLVEG